jgi:hypothetical protein
MPESGAVEAGKFGSAEVTQEDIRIVHEEHENECLGLLANIDHIAAAKISGIDPRTGSKPRTQKTQQGLRNYLDRTPSELWSQFDDMIAVYEDVFGPEAAEAFRAHLLGTHAEDTAETCNPTAGYDPGHPWHYYHAGDAARPVQVDEIPPASTPDSQLQISLPRNHATAAARLRSVLGDQRQQLSEDKSRYQELIDHVADATFAAVEDMLAGGCQQHEESVMPEVADFRVPLGLKPRALPLRHL